MLFIPGKKFEDNKKKNGEAALPKYFCVKVPRQWFRGKEEKEEEQKTEEKGGGGDSKVCSPSNHLGQVARHWKSRINQIRWRQGKPEIQRCRPASQVRDQRSGRKRRREASRALRQSVLNQAKRSGGPTNANPNANPDAPVLMSRQDFHRG